MSVNSIFLVFVSSVCLAQESSTVATNPAVIETVIAAATAESPRNSEGDLVAFDDGGLLAAWSEFYGGKQDDSAGRIRACRSDDGGQTWSEPWTMVENTGQENVMSASFLKLDSKELLLFYLEKNSRADLDVMVRRSIDQGKTWSQPVRITEDSGYWVMNNARVIQLSSGRIVCPAAMTQEVWSPGHRFRMVCFYSDDDGRTWQRSAGGATAPKRGAMEPGLIQRRDGSVLAYLRTQTGKQWYSVSYDGCDTWTRSQPWSLVSPEAPATLAVIPQSRHWLAVGNPRVDLDAGHLGKRTPLAVKVSADEGHSWSEAKLLEDDPQQTFSYTSVDFFKHRVLTTYYVRDSSGLISWKFKSLPVDWLPDPPAPNRLDRDTLLQYRDEAGKLKTASRLQHWQRRRAEVLAGMRTVMGPFPDDTQRCDLQTETLDETDMGTYVRQRIRYQSEPGCWTTAYLCLPKPTSSQQQKFPAVLCLHPTDNVNGHGVVVGLGGKPNRQYASELAERGFVTISPSYPHLADYVPNLAALGYVSGTMKAIWDNSRALDLLESLPVVDASPGFAAIGHSLGGHNAIYTAAFEPRIRAVVTSCGFDAYPDYYGGDLQKWKFGLGWCQIRYMPRLSNYREDLTEIPFDFTELLAVLAPRPVFINAPLHDSNFDWRSVDRCVAASAPVDELYGTPERVIVAHPDCDHDFPDAVREQAYQFIEQALEP